MPNNNAEATLLYALDVHGIQGFGRYLKDRLVGVFLELWLEIEGKHVTFLELWLGMASLELWLGMADEHEHSLSCSLDWRVLPV